MTVYFETMRRHRKSGSRIINRFIRDFQNEFARKIIMYTRHRLPDLQYGGFEHGFYYGEQSTKTFITAALDKICKSNVMQEYSIERKKPSDKKKAELGKGKLDYWCQYGKSTRVSILLEVKQDWIRYQNHPAKWTIYATSIIKHKTAVRQITQIKDKSQLTTGSILYGLALTVLPIYVRYKSSGDSEIRLNYDILNKIGRAAKTELKAHAYGCFSISKKMSPVDVWNEAGRAYIRENHPGVILVWSILKCTKK
jgi:hypothetical protein